MKDIYFLGIDDANRSEIIGSQWIAGVLVNKSGLSKLNTLPYLNDSKVVSKARRFDLYEWAKINTKHIAINIEPEEISSGENLNDLEAYYVALVIDWAINLCHEYSDDFKLKVYIDNWEYNETNFWKRMTVISDKISGIFINPFKDEYIVEHHADQKYKIVQLASVIAKCNSDLEKEKLRNEFGDFGSGNVNDPKTKQFILSNPDCIWIKKSYKTYKELIEKSL